MLHFPLFLACFSHAYLHLLRRLSRFPCYGVTMHAFQTLVGIYFKRRLCVFLRIALQCMRLTRVSASVKTVCAFSLVWRQSKYVSHASLHCLRQLLRFPWYGVKNVFHTCLCIYLDDIRVFLGMGSQCMRFTRLSASIRIAFAFFSVLRYNACVSHACLHQLRRLLHFSWYCVTMHAFQTRDCN